jgi:hypothetical protein
LPRLSAREGTDFVFKSPAGAATPRAGAIGVRNRRPAMARPVEMRIRGQATASPLAPKPVALIWRQESAGGETAAPSAALPHGSARRGTDLVWRRPAPAGPGIESGTTHEAISLRAPPMPATWRGETGAAASLQAAPTALQPVEMGRLVDEVVRRLDRIGRDERLRRGL